VAACGKYKKKKKKKHCKWLGEYKGIELQIKEMFLGATGRELSLDVVARMEQNISVQTAHTVLHPCDRVAM